MNIIISRILIVAEEKQVVDDLLEFFENNDFEAEIALNSKIAINIMKDREMELIIVGYKDQDSINYTIIEDIRGADIKVPIIVIGGEKSKRTENKFFKLGAQVFLPDPVEKDELLNEVKKIAENEVKNIA